MGMGRAKRQWIKLRKFEERHGRQIIRDWKVEAKCKLCGSEKDIQFHHKNPKKKEYNICSLVRLGATSEQVKQEMAKCVPLCNVCHKRVHKHPDSYPELIVRKEENVRSKCAS